MIIIDKNLSHGCGVVLARDFYVSTKGGGNYFKSSSMFGGIQSIEREIKGFIWYLHQSGYHYEFEVICRTERYIQVRYPRIVGEIPNFKLGYFANIPIIEKVVDHYITVWSPYSLEERAPIHGDLSLFGNILFTREGPFILDWEHFLLRGAPIGFDILYFLFELLYFGKYKRSDSIITEHLVKMIRLLESKSCVSEYFKDGYLKKVIDFIDSDKNIWGRQKYKLPLRFFARSLIDFIDAQLK